MDNFFENLIDYPRTGLTDQMFKLIGECLLFAYYILPILI